MQHAEGANRQRMAQHATEPPVRRVFDLAKPVAVDKLGPPCPDRAGPRVQGVLSACFGHEGIAAPAIVIPADPKHRDPGVVQVRERRKDPKARARHGMAPAEPEIEQVTHDHQRASARGHIAQQPQQGTLCLLRGDAEVRVADDQCRNGKHTRSLTVSERGHKHTAPPLGAWAGRGHLPITPFRRPVPVSPMPALVSETISELRVRYAETDQMGVVYHANYLVWCELGRTDFIRALGKSYAELEREGVLLAVSDVTMRFHDAARYDDPIRVYTRLTSAGSRGLAFSYRITHADTETLLVSATTALVSINRTGRLAAMPREVRAVLEAAVTQANHVR
jgi:acyl-CoA thioester hydrolase